MLPIIICAPHAQTSIDDPKLKSRFRLTDYEIWKCSDPFTNELKEFTCAAKKIIAKTHRLVCDLNRAPNYTDCFHTKDFFGRNVFVPGKSFTKAEKTKLLTEHWWPFHEKIEKEVLEMDKKEPGVILIVDYHNTSGDHPLGTERGYMPSFVISDLDGVVDKNTGKTINGKMLPKKYLKILKKDLESRLPVPVETNKIYHGGFDMQWYLNLAENLGLKSKLYAIQVEYNLDFIANPITKKIDRQALQTMQTALNGAIETMYRAMVK